MSETAISKPSVIRFFLLVSLLPALLAGAEELALPVARPLDPDTSLVLFLEDTVLEVTIDAEAPARLAARSLAEGIEDPEALEIETRGRELHLHRRADPEAKRRIALTLVVRPGQSLEVNGRRLEVTLTAPIVEPAPSDDNVPSAAALESRFDGLRWLYRLRLEESDAVVVGLEALELEATESTLELRGTRGPLAATLTGGSLASEDHDGPLRLDSTGVKVALTHQVGGLHFRAAGGELTVLGGEGPYVGTAVENAAVSLLDWQGQAVLLGENARYEIRDSAEGAELTLEGRDLDADVVRLRGAFTATLDGGRLAAAEIAAATRLTGRAEAALSVEGLSAENATIELTGDATAHLSDVDAELESQVEGARLEVDGVRQFGVKALDADVTARGIAAVSMLALKNSDFDLDLSEIRRHPAMALRAASQGRLVLAQPCVVRLAGEIAFVEEHADVTGCELVTFASPKKERLRGQQGYPDGYTVLVTNLETGSRLEVEGIVLP